MTLRVQHERETLPWLLSWGADAYVVEPEALRHRLAREAQRVAAQYREAPTLMDG
jgi:predicted DNA-binding transcriptional regulator YafY